MSDNTKQFRWIVAIQGGLATQYRDDPNVLVVGDLLWYPVEGNNKIRLAPDTMVIFGRPKGDRGSYIQHREAGVTPQVVFEVLSPSNRAAEMRGKLAFYEQYGVEEYYILDPDHQRHRGYLRDDQGQLTPIAALFGWISPRMGIRFEVTEELRIIGTDGLKFEFYEVESTRRRLAEQTARAEQRARRKAIRQAAAADQEAASQRQARLAADQEAASQRQARLAADQEAASQRQQVEQLHAKLRAMGIDPNTL